VALSFIAITMPKTIVYIDGFNLYYGLLRRSPYKWLDLVSLFANHVLAGVADVTEVRYYTAPILGKMSDDPASAMRQRTYLQALRKLYPSRLQIIEGQMIAGKSYQRLVSPIAQAPELKSVQVYSFDEKKTDINLATDLLNSAWRGDYDQAVLCSNDSDLEPALAMARREHPHLRLGLVALSIQNTVAKDLMKECHWGKLLNPAHLAAAQMPDKIPFTAIRKPEKW
jgi:uncharacterized LabA/DUF88 family protein